MCVKTFLWLELHVEKEQSPGQICNKIKTNFIAYELLVERVVTFGVVQFIVTNHLYISLCSLQNCRWVVLSNTKILCLEIIFSNVIK